MTSMLYIGTGMGVYTARSEDRHAWEVVRHDLSAWEVSELAVSPLSPGKAYAATRGDGVWRTDDFGKTWRKPCWGRRGPGKVRAITVDPHAPRRLYASCEPVDIYVSEDEGASWTRIDSLHNVPSIATMTYPLATVEPHARDVAVDPADPNTLYAALQLGYIIKSTDRGRSWTLLDHNYECDVHTISIDPGNPQRLVIATGGHDSRAGKAPGRALYASDDGGANWSPVAMNMGKEYSVPLTRDPRDPNRIYAALATGTNGRWKRRESGAESELARSADGGRSWERAGTWPHSKEFPEAIAIDAKGRVYAGCRSGALYASDDDARSWQRIGLELPEITSVMCIEA